MSEIDWSKAPEDAQEYAPSNRYFYKQEDGAWFFWRPDLNKPWQECKMGEPLAEERIPRPTKQEWDGGLLPEVGVECEFIHPGITSEGWQVGTIKAYFDDRVVIKSNPSIWPACGYAVILIDEELKFRPLKSQHELQREELCAIASKYSDLGHVIVDDILARYTLEPKP